jgi:methylmalonyl-CoA carboxyltransferase 5S subunit
MTRRIEITELALRDAHQSLLATRMALDDMIPACADLDNAGYWSLECWGGDLRFLHSLSE